ncbi:hypothetical protein D3C80_1794980 [compost metagenome]
MLIAVEHLGFTGIQRQGLSLQHQRQAAGDHIDNFVPACGIRQRVVAFARHQRPFPQLHPLKCGHAGDQHRLACRLAPLPGQFTHQMIAACFRCLDQIGEGDIQRLGKFVQHRQADITVTGFNPGQHAAADAGFFRQRHLT